MKGPLPGAGVERIYLLSPEVLVKKRGVLDTLA